MNGADYIAAFLVSKGVDKVFLMTGGAAAFMIDAIGRNPAIDYVCFHHEQSAAMAADAVWRVNRKVGVAMATSGPGATNLITGIACSYFDSIPTIHITGQVNMRESSAYLGATPRQAGFQETKIVAMVKPITKYAVQVRTAEELKQALDTAWTEATTGRMGPVLIDVPMDVQQMEVGELEPRSLVAAPFATKEQADILQKLQEFFTAAKRPLIYLGAGIGLAGIEQAIEKWLSDVQIPFVASWNSTTYFNHSVPNYHGCVGVYGNRGANFLVQNCDSLLVIGSRLDNRQRSSRPNKFAPHAKVLVIDIDQQELAKFKIDNYETICCDLKILPAIIANVQVDKYDESWSNYALQMKNKYFGKNVSTYAASNQTQSPYEAIRKFNSLIAKDAIVVNDTGAALCWFFQVFHRDQQTVFTAGGNSPMGYGLPAAIGAKIIAPDAQVICFIGDGGFQLNIQELSLLNYHRLNIKIVIMNNAGYGIIKQFQDANLSGRYFATENGYSLPNFQGIVEGYGLKYIKITDPAQITAAQINSSESVVFDVILDPNTQIEPKVEMGRPINDQFPYMSDAEYMEGNAFFTYERS